MHITCKYIHMYYIYIHMHTHTHAYRIYMYLCFFFTSLGLSTPRVVPPWRQRRRRHPGVAPSRGGPGGPAAAAPGRRRRPASASPAARWRKPDLEPWRSPKTEGIFFSSDIHSIFWSRMKMVYQNIIDIYIYINIPLGSRWPGCFWEFGKFRESAVIWDPLNQLYGWNWVHKPRNDAVWNSVNKTIGKRKLHKDAGDHPKP